MMPAICALLVINGYSDAIRINENAWSPFEYVEYKYSTVELYPNQNSIVYTASFKSASNGTWNRVTVNQLSRTITLWHLRDKVIRRTNTEDSILPLEKNKLYIAYDARLEILRCVLGRDNQINTLAELEAKGIASIRELDDRYELKYSTNSASSILTIDKLRNGMISSMDTIIMEPSNKGGIIKKKVTQWNEPEPGLFFPKTIQSEYTDQAGKLQYLRETRVQFISNGNKVSKIDEWKPAPSTMVFDKINKLQYKTGAEGKPLRQDKLAELPRMINTSIAPEKQSLWKSLWLWSAVTMAILLLSRFIYRYRNKNI